MAQQQQSVTVTAPGAFGMNSEASPLTLGSEWAIVAYNAVIDQYGRLGARKGYNVLTTDNTALGTEPIHQIHEHIALAGTKTVFSCGNNKIFSGTTTLTDLTGALTITADEWQIVSLNDDCFFFQAGHDPVVYDQSTTTLQLVSAHPLYAATVPVADAVLSAYGRLWVANTATSKSIVYWSRLLVGPDWTTDSGSIDVEKFWPNGTDEIVALAAHNGYLLIFGKESIIVYDGADDDPASNLVLTDAIAEIGIVDKHAYISVGPELLFVDKSGVRAFSRIIQEKSLPIGDITKNVRRVFQTQVGVETADVQMTYSSDEGFVLVNLPSVPGVWCFDVKTPLQDGTFPVTFWPGLAVYGMEVLQAGDLYMGTNDGIIKYSGFIDGDTTYRYRYYSTPLDFGNPSQQKYPKQMCLTITGGPQEQAVAYWGYDYKYDFEAQPFVLDAADLDFYNTVEDEYNNQGDPDVNDPTEYTGGFGIKRYCINMSGSGLALTVGLEIKVENSAVSLQEIDIKALTGRLS